MQMVTANTEETSAETSQSEAAESVAAHATGWFSAWRQRAHLVVDLALAEAKLAAISVALMAFLGFLAAACLLVAWGLLVAGLVNSTLSLGLQLWSILFGLALLHVVAAVLLMRSVLKVSNNVGFVETRGQFAQQESSS